jgi:hypothetical protein
LPKRLQQAVAGEINNFFQDSSLSATFFLCLR